MIPIISGKGIYGKVDRVPGFFSIGTLFHHIYYLPLIPLKSYVLLKQSGKTYSGVEIRAANGINIFGLWEGILDPGVGKDLREFVPSWA